MLSVLTQYLNYGNANFDIVSSLRNRLLRNMSFSVEQKLMVHRELKADALWQHRGVGWGGIGGVSRGMEHETSCSGLGHWDDPEG